MADDNVIRMLHDIRKHYYSEQKFHYLTFAAFAMILLLDIIIIIYVRAITLSAYAWAGIILLFVLMAIEGIQYKRFSNLIGRVDEFYLSGEYHGNKR
jgi:hypothetical protein